MLQLAGRADTPASAELVGVCLLVQNNPLWTALSVPEDSRYKWEPDSTYINSPPFFKGITAAPAPGGAKVSHARFPSERLPHCVSTSPPYSDEKVANRDTKVWHGATENGNP